MKKYTHEEISDMSAQEAKSFSENFGDEVAFGIDEHCGVSCAVGQSCSEDFDFDMILMSDVADIIGIYDEILSDATDELRDFVPRNIAKPVWEYACDKFDGKDVQEIGEFVDYVRSLYKSL